MDFEIDLDSECVWLGDAWFNRDDLVRKIRAMIDAGDFQIALASNALEELTRALASARLLALRMSPEMSDALHNVALQMERPIGAIVREAVANYLSSLTSLHSQKTEPVSATEQIASAVIRADDPISQPPSEGTPIFLKRKDEREEVEKRWFDK
jgi:predicted DNA-binding protein